MGEQGSSETGYIKGFAWKASQEEGGVGLGHSSLQGFLNQFTALPACFTSTMYLQHAYANDLESIKDHLQKTRDVCVCVCDLVFSIPLHAARRAMAAVVGFSIYLCPLRPDWSNRS